MKRKTKVAARMSAAQMHALAAVRREIRSRDSAARSKYLREFTQSFREYEGVLSDQELGERISAASIVRAGDYHALPAAQDCAANLLKQIAQGAPVVLGVEAVLARDQRILDSWWRQGIGEEELRQRIRFDRDWGYDWAPFYRLLTAAREHGEVVYGLDCQPRDDLRSIRSRDRHAAAKICEIRQRHPGAVILIVFGESHMAPRHLPALLRQLLPQERMLTVLQNIDPLYWRAVSEGAAAVSVNDETVCVFNSSPLEKYESYRLCLERWNAPAGDSPDFSLVVHNLIASLASSLDFRMDSPRNGTQPKFLADSLPEVITVDEEVAELFSGSQLAAEFAGPGNTRVRLEQTRRTVVARLEEQGCVYVPAANRFYVRELRIISAAAEAARFLHHACTGFNSRELSNVQVADALAYFGSRLLCPMPQEAGNVLGEDLYRTYLEGRIGKAEIRRIFLGQPISADEIKASPRTV